MPQSEEKRSNRKTRIGTVISDKMDKTITVSVERVGMHHLYNKLVRTATKFKVHDEKDEAGIGDTVTNVSPVERAMASDENPPLEPVR